MITPNWADLELPLSISTEQRGVLETFARVFETHFSLQSFFSNGSLAEAQYLKKAEIKSFKMRRGCGGEHQQGAGVIFTPTVAPT